MLYIVLESFFWKHFNETKERGYVDERERF
jgi:hypothetical protein